MRTGLLQYAEGSWIGTGGFIEDGDQRLQIRHVQPVATPTDLAKIVIKEENGQQVYISDVAKIVEDHQAMIGDGIVNDDIGLLLIVEKFPWGNTLEVTRRGLAVYAARPIGTTHFSMGLPRNQATWIA